MYFAIFEKDSEITNILLPEFSWASVKHLNMHLFFQRVTKNPKYRTIAFIAVSLLLIIYLNWSVCKTAKSQVEQLALLIGNTSARSNNIQQQEMLRRIKHWNAGVDIIIIIASFLLCFPVNQVFHTTLCNLIIFSIRKREFRSGVRNLLKRFKLYGSMNQINDEVILTNYSRFRVAPKLQKNPQQTTASNPLAITPAQEHLDAYRH